MKNISKLMVLVLLFAFTASIPAYAKKDGDPAGWLKGKKKGWDGGQTPPGLSKKDQGAAEKDLKKKQKEAEKQAKKAQKEAEKKANEAKKKLQG